MIFIIDLLEIKYLDIYTQHTLDKWKYISLET